MSNIMRPQLPAEPGAVRTVQVTRPPRASVQVDSCDWRGLEIGSVECGCQGTPKIYRCDCPAVTVGYCLLHAAGKPIKDLRFHDGRSVKVEGRINDAVPLCSFCQHRKTDAPVDTPQQLGDRGIMMPPASAAKPAPVTLRPPAPSYTVDASGFSPDDKPIRVMHLMGSHWWKRAGLMCSNFPPRALAARRVLGTTVEDSAAISEFGAQVVVIHALEGGLQAVESLATRHPAVQFVCIFHGSQNVLFRTPTWPKMQHQFLEASQRRANVWYATPEPSAAETLASLGYKRAICWPNTRPPAAPVDVQQAHDPATLLIAGRWDILKCYSVAVLAAGLINRQRPCRVLTVIDGPHRESLEAVAVTARVPIAHEPWLAWPDFMSLIRDRVTLTLCPSLTDSFNYVAWDSLAQGRPVIGSAAIRYLPAVWMADPNDPADIAERALRVLDDYPAASRCAGNVSTLLARVQQKAYVSMLERVTGS